MAWLAELAQAAQRRADVRRRGRGLNQDPSPGLGLGVSGLCKPSGSDAVREWPRRTQSSREGLPVTPQEAQEAAAKRWPTIWADAPIELREELGRLWARSGDRYPVVNTALRDVGASANRAHRFVDVEPPCRVNRGIPTAPLDDIELVVSGAVLRIETGVDSRSQVVNERRTQCATGAGQTRGGERAEIQPATVPSSGLGEA